MEWINWLLNPANAGNTLGLAGMMLLAVPALYAAHRAKNVHIFAGRKPGSRVHPRFHEGWRTITQHLRDRLHEWSRFHMFCLYAGYTCLLMSYLVRFLPQS